MHRLLSSLKFSLLDRFGGIPRRRPVGRYIDVPDFLGIGVPQGATTWLYENLRRHPDVYFPGTKELEYFTKRFYRSFAWYTRAFRPGRGKIRGEITPGYCSLHRRQVRIVSQYLPKARIFIVLRDPVERVWSAARRVLGWRYQADLSKAPDEAFLSFFARPDVKARTDYPAILDNWRTFYPDEQILVLFFHEVTGYPERSLGRIFEHIGASTDVDVGEFPLRRKVNANPTLAIPPRFQKVLCKRYHRVIDEVHRRFGPAAAPWMASSRPLDGPCLSGLD